jgi:hypothetical protein
LTAFGYETTQDDEFVRIAEEAQLAMVSAARPGAYLVDFLPFLKYVPEWMPGAGFRRVAREGRELAEDLQKKPFAWALQQLEQGTAKPSFFTRIMDAKGLATDDPVEEREIVQKACAVMYASKLGIILLTRLSAEELSLAGADTILASVLTFVLGMLHSPHVQKKAHDEIQRVVGSDRLPTLADRDALPYINSIVKETYRWELGQLPERVCLIYTQHCPSQSYPSASPIDSLRMM